MYTYGWTGLTYTPAHRNIGVDSDASFAYIEECESLTRTIIRINNLMKKKKSSPWDWTEAGYCGSDSAESGT